MRILVTGGTGFLGRHLLPLLSGHELFVICRDNDANRQFADNISCIQSDLSKGIEPVILPDKMDAVFHLAQSGRYRDATGGASDLFKINVEVPSTLLRWAEKAGVSRFIAASSGSVYEPYSGQMTENSVICPTSYYAVTKLATETLSLAYQDRFNVCQLRVFFLYGPGQQAMLIANLIKNIREGKPLSLPSMGEGLEFTPTYVTDAAHTFAKACEDQWSGVYNIASPNVTNLKKVIEQIGKGLDMKPVIERINAPKPVSIIPNLEKISTMIDIQSFHTFKQGIAKTLAAK